MVLPKVCDAIAYFVAYFDVSLALAKFWRAHRDTMVLSPTVWYAMALYLQYHGMPRQIPWCAAANTMACRGKYHGMPRQIPWCYKTVAWHTETCHGDCNHKTTCPYAIIGGVLVNSTGLARLAQLGKPDERAVALAIGGQILPEVRYRTRVCSSSGRSDE